LLFFPEVFLEAAGRAFLGAAPGGAGFFVFSFQSGFSISQILGFKLTGSYPRGPLAIGTVLEFPVRTHQHGSAPLPGQQALDHLVGPLAPPGINHPYSLMHIAAFPQATPLPTVKNHGDFVLGAPPAIIRQGLEQGFPARLQVPGIYQTKPGGLADEVVAVNDQVYCHNLLLIILDYSSKYDSEIIAFRRHQADRGEEFRDINNFLILDFFPDDN
jgi:hypothetical protein